MNALSCPFTFSHLCCGYGGADVLHDVSGELRPGTVTVLIGPNGGGKSTLLRALAGFLPYRGTVSLKGRELKSYSRAELGRMVGILAQRAKASNGFTVCDVIALGRLPWRKGFFGSPALDDERAVLDAARRLDVGHLLERPVTELSGGEVQRVFLAMIVAQDAPVCLLDEPSSAMDPLNSRFTSALTRSLAAEGKAVAAAVHDVNAALFADRYLAVKDGKILSSGRADEIGAPLLEELYGTPFAAYISSNGDTVWYPCAKF